MDEATGVIVIKIYVFSDSHGDSQTMDTLVRIGKPDTVLFLGDCLADILPLQDRWGIRCELIAGNTDHEAIAWEIVVCVEGVRIFMTHGHTYKNGSDIRSIFDAAHSHDAHIALFGHTHAASMTSMNGFMLINPGSVNASYWEASYAIMDVDDGYCTCSLHRVNDMVGFTKLKAVRPFSVVKREGRL